MGSFLARAVVDEVLAPAFLSNRNNTHPGDCVVEKAVSLLSREHCTARLEKVWGPGDGRPVSELKEIMDQLLKVRDILLFGKNTSSLHVSLLTYLFPSNERRSIYYPVSSMRRQAASANSKPVTSTTN